MIGGMNYASTIILYLQLVNLLSWKRSSTAFADAVYIHRPMQYIFNRVCSIYSFFRGMYWLFADIHLVYITMHLISLKRTSSCINAGAVFDIASASMFIILFFLCSFHARFSVVIYNKEYCYSY